MKNPKILQQLIEARRGAEIPKKLKLIFGELTQRELDIIEFAGIYSSTITLQVLAITDENEK